MAATSIYVRCSAFDTEDEIISRNLAAPLANS
jgi:hypothetical protein